MNQVMIHLTLAERVRFPVVNEEKRSRRGIIDFSVEHITAVSLQDIEDLALGVCAGTEFTDALRSSLRRVTGYDFFDTV
jgi:hypothetical protein